MQNLKNIGYPYFYTNEGFFNITTNKADNAKNKLILLLSTNVSQRILSNNCEFGINIQKLLFENIQFPNFDQIFKNEIKKVIKRWIREIEEVQVQLENTGQTLIIKLSIWVDQEYRHYDLELNINE